MLRVSNVHVQRFGSEQRSIDRLGLVRQWRIMQHAFVETPIFTRAVASLLSDEEYRQLQLALLTRPEQG